MFQRFNRYVLWEITKLFTVALVAFTTLIMLVGVAQQLVSQGLGPWATLELIPYVLPISLQFALPATLLFAVCSVYGRISADNEILAVMASGVKPLRVITPTLIASFLLSLFAVWLNDIAFYWGRPGMNRVVMHSIEPIIYGVLATHGSYSSHEGLSIHVHGIGEDGRELIQPTFTLKSGGSPIEITAKSARLSCDPVREQLDIELIDAMVEFGDSFLKLPDLYTYSIHLSEATRKGTAAGHPSEYAMRQISGAIRETRKKIVDAEELLATRTAMGLAVGRYEWLEDEQARHLLWAISDGQNHTNRLHLEPWRRWASGFSCLFFVWVGIPFSTWMRSADHWTSFGGCFLPILLLYYPAFAVGMDHAKDGSWPAIAVWLGNLVLLAAGAFWLRKISRY